MAAIRATSATLGTAAPTASGMPSIVRHGGSAHSIFSRGWHKIGPHPMSDAPLRKQLVRILDWEESHVGFDKAVEGMPADKRGTRPAGFEYSAWQLLEHMRIAQEDILDFCVNPKYVHSRTWPDDYWPKDPAPPDASAWDASIAAFTRDREQMKQVALHTKDLYASVPTGDEKQTYLRAVLLVTDHNSYHLGQFIAVRRALGVWN